MWASQDSGKGYQELPTLRERFANEVLQLFPSTAFYSEEHDHLHLSDEQFLI
jgi:hypothetical protein